MNKMFCFQCEQTAGCKACTGAAGVCGKKADTAHLQDKEKGDVNADGDFTVADLVMLQNYLVRKGEITDRQAGDLCEDGKLDVYDVVAMRQMLTEK